MNPGKLNKKAAFQMFKREHDGAGGFIEEWEDVFTIWANVKGLNPQHKLFLEQPGTFTHTWVIVRKNSKKRPQPRMRMFIDGNRYNVLSVREYTPDTKYWEIEAVEISP